ncbi:PREDICTED: WAP four-disulfide core domain protein 1 [Ficedula albicollis]|uniref:WAP four-disulfide core domain protein 1 n=1 Tax=Ficedula albicollis TaxID=59894 RepID=UPI0007AD7F02|nr:PREDICTED: WAP four-disulfide core domain protein 1 [Ficedula albicollis]
MGSRLLPEVLFCKKVLAAALCALVVLPEPGSARTLWKRALLKMTEKYDDYEYPLHSQSSQQQKSERCPPPPQSLPERACLRAGGDGHLRSLQPPPAPARYGHLRRGGLRAGGDGHLRSLQPPPAPARYGHLRRGGLRAGGDGHLRSLQPPPAPARYGHLRRGGLRAGGDGHLRSLQPPPGTDTCAGVGSEREGMATCGPCSPRQAVLDWLVQPKPRWLGGNGWLLDGPEEVLQAEACSTTEDGDEPLHCPTGYECHIISPGNTAEGIPNRGQCIKQRGNTDGHNLRHKYYKEYFGSNSNNLVGYVKNQQKHLG